MRTLIMAEQEQKSNYTLIVAVCAVLSIGLVVLLKSRETEHLNLEGAGTTLESNAAELSGAKRFKNDYTE